MKPRTPEQKRQHADYTREWRKRVNADPERRARMLKLKREAGKRYRAKHGAVVSNEESKRRYRELKRG